MRLNRRTDRSIALPIVLAAACLVASRVSALEVVLDVPYDTIPGVDPNLLSLDIYSPDAADGTNPVMLMIHGGSFVSGDKAITPVVHPKMDYYTDRGWVFVSANYRLTDPALSASDPAQVSHPDHIQDVARAVVWTHENIAQFGGDPGKLLLMGFSAGAQLVALVATDASRLQAEGLTPDDLMGVIALDGLYDVPLRYAQIPPPPMQNALIWGTDLASWLDMSPVAHVAPSESIPPVLVVHQDAFNNMEQSSTFVATLLAAGFDAGIFNAVGLTHAEIGASVGVPGHAMTEVVDDFLVVALPEPAPALGLSSGLLALSALHGLRRSRSRA